MAKINPMTHLDSMVGKYAKTDQVYTKVRKKDERVTGVRVKHPATNQPPSAAQRAAQDKLTATAARVKAAFENPETVATYRQAFKKQRRYKTFTGYVFHLLYNVQEGGE